MLQDNQRINAVSATGFAYTHASQDAVVDVHLWNGAPYLPIPSFAMLRH